MSVPGSSPSSLLTRGNYIEICFADLWRALQEPTKGNLFWVGKVHYCESSFPTCRQKQQWKICWSDFLFHFRKGHWQIRNFSSGVCVWHVRETSRRIRKVKVGLQSLPHTHTQFIDTAMWPLRNFPIHTCVFYVHRPDEDGTMEMCRVSNCE